MFVNVVLLAVLLALEREFLILYRLSVFVLITIGLFLFFPCLLAALLMCFFGCMLIILFLGTVLEQNLLAFIQIILNWFLNSACELVQCPMGYILYNTFIFKPVYSFCFYA